MITLTKRVLPGFSTIFDYTKYNAPTITFKLLLLTCSLISVILSLRHTEEVEYTNEP